MRAPQGSKFHAVFGKIWQNRMLASPLKGWRPHLGEILDPPLISYIISPGLQLLFIAILLAKIE